MNRIRALSVAFNRMALETRETYRAMLTFQRQLEKLPHPYGHPELHQALCEIADELGCPDLTMVGDRQPPHMWQRQRDLILSVPEPERWT